MKHFVMAGVFGALGMASAAMAQMVTPAQFVAEAGASDKFEIESAKLETGSSNPDLANFANQMVTDHMASTQKVKTAAMADKLAVKPPMLTAKQTKDLASLKAASGPARDTLYIQQQKMAHAEALTLMQSYSSSGTAPHLKAAAGAILPVVQMHKDMIDKM